MSKIKPKCDWTIVHLPSGHFFSGFTSVRAAQKWFRKYVVNGPCPKGRAYFYKSKWNKDILWCEHVFIRTEDAMAAGDLTYIFDHAHGFRRIE